METKETIRSHLKTERDRMTIPELIEKSERILAGVMTVLNNFSFVSLHCYEPIARLHEVDVSELLDLPNVSLYTSRKMGSDWNVVTVSDGSVQKQPSLDVIIVPMLGFDKRLHRIGYGGGYYDRLLSLYPQALKIGVCFEQGRLDQLPAEPHDIPLNLVVTETSAVIAV